MKNKLQIFFLLLVALALKYTSLAQGIGVHYKEYFPNFNSLPDSLKSSDGFNLSNYSLDKFVSEIKHPEKIKILSIECDSDFIISDKISCLFNLNNLQVTSKSISRISPEIVKCKKLQTLDLVGISCEIPKELFSIKAIKTLLLSGSFKYLPDALNNLTNLGDLYLHSPNLLQFPLQVSGLKNLYELRILSSSLNDFPASICNLHQLEKLFFMSSNISKIPACISNLSKLTYLVISDCKIDTLPEEFYDLVNLTTLSLDNNKLKSLSPSVAKFKELAELELGNNQLSNLPKEISVMKHGHILLKDNPITPEVLNKIKKIIPDIQIIF